MIILDTHIWIWHVQEITKLRPTTIEIIKENESSGLGVSAISLWEVAKAVANRGLELPLPVDEWLDAAVAYPGIHVVPLTTRIAVGSTQLPGTFHKDPADQIIVATARVLDCPLVTYDAKILNYDHVKLLS
jgi:PIN domain nuclease of toxin-antitoxin system